MLGGSSSGRGGGSGNSDESPSSSCCIAEAFGRLADWPAFYPFDARLRKHIAAANVAAQGKYRPSFSLARSSVRTKMKAQQSSAIFFVGNAYLLAIMYQHLDCTRHYLDRVGRHRPEGISASASIKTTRVIFFVYASVPYGRVHWILRDLTFSWYTNAHRCTADERIPNDSATCIGSEYKL